jgi:hypothetical protein
MNYQKLLDAKIKLAEVNATIAIIVGAVILFLCAIAIMIGFIKSLDDKYYGDAPFALYIIGGLVAIMGVIVLGSGIYDKSTAQIRAEADMANYNLVEIAK